MFPILEVHGTAHERGRMHGKLARKRIDHSVATYARLFAYCGIDWQGAQALGAGYRDLIGALDAELLEEIEGIAAGSGRRVDEILALNARTEILPPTYPGEPHPGWTQIAAANVAAGVPDWGECTSVAVKPGQSSDRDDAACAELGLAGCAARGARAPSWHRVRRLDLPDAD